MFYKLLMLTGLMLVWAVPAQAQNAITKTPKDKFLVVYFSQTGNTKQVASKIQTLLGSDIFEIKAERNYSSNYNSLVDEAQEEQKNDARPALTTKVDNMADYEVIFLGYPNWWGTMPMPLFTFLTEYDFSGKTIVPFCTHEGSGLGGSVSDIKKLSPNAIVVEGLAIRGRSAGDSEKDISAWLKKLGYLAE